MESSPPVLYPGVCSEFFIINTWWFMEALSCVSSAEAERPYLLKTSLIPLIRPVKALSITDFLYSDTTGAL